MSVGQILIIPASILADMAFNSYVLPPMSFVGMGLITSGFVCVVVAQYLSIRKEEMESEMKDRATGEEYDDEPLLVSEDPFVDEAADNEDDDYLSFQPRQNVEVCQLFCIPLY